MESGIIYFYLIDNMMIKCVMSVSSYNLFIMMLFHIIDICLYPRLNENS